MTAPILYITGTNTGVGKTTLATLLLEAAQKTNLRVAAMKPFCSGGREDAERLQALQTAGLTLDQVNPYHFPEPVTPLIAARNAGQKIPLHEILEKIRALQKLGLPLLIEGAGGLMSPLGENFTLLDIIQKIPGKVAVVGTNTLGIINAALLTARALALPSSEIMFILMNATALDPSSATNAPLIAEWTHAPATEFPNLTSSATERGPLLQSVLNFWVNRTHPSQQASPS